MFGLIIGDIAGSFREHMGFNKHPELGLFPGAGYSSNLDLGAKISVGLTDDSILAIATSLVCQEINNPTALDFAGKYHEFGNRFRDPLGGYGNSFEAWLNGDSLLPYGSFGNGAAMRVAPVAYFGKTAQAVFELATASAMATHDHPEGVKGARFIALLTWHCLHKTTDPEAAIREEFGITYGRSSGYNYFDATCQETIPLALHCVQTTSNFHDAVFKAVTVPNGDSDTLGAIVGAVSEAKYGIPEELRAEALKYVQEEFKSLLNMACAVPSLSNEVYSMAR